MITIPIWLFTILCICAAPVIFISVIIILTFFGIIIGDYILR